MANPNAPVGERVKASMQSRLGGTLSPDRSTRAAQMRILGALLDGKAVMGYHGDMENRPAELGSPVTNRGFIPAPQGARTPKGAETHLPVFTDEAAALCDMKILKHHIIRDGPLARAHVYSIHPRRINQVKCLLGRYDNKAAMVDRMRSEGILSTDKGYRAMEIRILQALLDNKVVISYPRESAANPEELGRPGTKRRFIRHPYEKCEYLPVHHGEIFPLHTREVITKALLKKHIPGVYVISLKPEKRADVEKAIAPFKRKR